MHANLPVGAATLAEGEANAHNTKTGNAYFCQMVTMIADWRARWHLSGNINADFPFIIAGLAPAGGGASPVIRCVPFPRCFGYNSMCAWWWMCQSIDL